MDRRQILQGNWDRVQAEIHEACQSANRTADSVRLIAITKYVDANVVRELYDIGCRAIGESRPQVLMDKYEPLQDLDLEWHLVGQLQSNKSKRMVARADYIHSIDSWELLRTVHRHAVEMQKTVKLLLEVHLTGEATKAGFHPTELETLEQQLADLSHVSVVGFMGMAELDGPEARVRQQFANLRLIRDRWLDVGGSQHPLNQLSMGMSGDFHWAIAEGATMVRVGSNLFTGLI